MAFGRRKSVLRGVLALIIVLSAAGISVAEDDDDAKPGAKSEHAKSEHAKSEHADEGVDTEHIFGFTEGTDIGEKGEREIEITTVGSLGKIGAYAEVFNETAFRYVITDNLRLSVGTLADFYSIHGVPDLTNRTLFGLSGLDAEARLVVVDHHNAPFGLDVSVNPQWRHLDKVSGAATQSFALPMSVVLLKDIIPGKLYTAVNFTYAPLIARLNGLWLHEDSFETDAAISGAIAPNVFLGAEVRHLSVAENGTFRGQALFTGPSLYAKLANNFEAKIAWSAQVTDFSKHGLDLENFERHQILLLFAYTF